MTDQPDTTDLTPGEAARAQRRADILDHLRANGSRTVHQLSDELHLTDTVVRADLARLTDDGLVGRAYGDPPLNSYRYFAAAQEA